MSRSPWGVAFTEVMKPPSHLLCVRFISFLSYPHRHRGQDVWQPLGELQAGCHVLWGPQRAEARLHVPAEGSLLLKCLLVAPLPSQTLDRDLLPPQSPPPATFLPLQLHHQPFDTGSCFPLKSSLNMDEHFSKNNCVYNSLCVFQITVSGVYQ